MTCPHGKSDERLCYECWSRATGSGPGKPFDLYEADRPDMELETAKAVREAMGRPDETKHTWRRGTLEGVKFTVGKGYQSIAEKPYVWMGLRAVDEAPREWWIELGQEGDAIVWHTPIKQAVHVIEKSAYDRVCAERDSLQKEVQSLRHELKMCGDLRTENARLREALDWCAKGIEHFCNEEDEAQREYMLKHIEKVLEGK